MSGGYWQYLGSRLNDACEQIAEDVTVLERWPRLAELLSALGPVLQKAEHAMDWDLSGDSPIDDDAAFQDIVCHAILEAAMKSADDRLFPRGKWATIQAVQERMCQ